ncbi:MAG: hypothetical protein WEB28_00415 [Nitrosopumilaceae archaeon]
MDKLMLSSIDVVQFYLFSKGKCHKYQMNSILQGILSFVLISGLILSPFMLNVNADQNEIMSPRKQMATGIKADSVKCKSGLVLMIRSTNDSAACVKLTASAKLSQVGWGKVVDLNMEKVPTVEPIKQPESKEKKKEGNIVKVNVKDGVGSKDK